MSTSLRRFLVPFPGLLLLAPAAGALTPQSLEPLRVMPVGDSITQGGNGYGSWRYWLWFSLPPAPVFDMVGDRHQVSPRDLPGNPDLGVYIRYYAGFDPDHEAFWGARSDQVAGQIFRAVDLTHPDVLLVHLGTNDIGQLGVSGLENARTYLTRLLTEARAAQPGVQVFLAQIIPIARSSGYGAATDLVPILNGIIGDVAAAESTLASPITLVDQYTGFEPLLELQSGGVHPNVLGEHHMAANWLASLLAHLDPPRPPREFTPLVLDPSFESLELADFAMAERPPGPWHSGGTTNTLRGIYNPGGNTYYGAEDDGVPAGADGAHVAYLYDYGPGDESVALYQTLATTCELGGIYTLTVAVGNRFQTNPYGPSTFGGFKIELLSGSTVLASVADTFVPPPGEFRDATLAFSANPLAPKLRRRALTVRMRLTNGLQGSATDFDNVRLSVK